MREAARAGWQRIGRLYAQENRDDLRDRMEHDEQPKHYPPGIERPEFGCRELVQRNLGKILPACWNDARDWVPQVRLQSIALVRQLLIHAEAHVTMELERTTVGLTRAANDDEKLIVERVSVHLRCS